MRSAGVVERQVLSDGLLGVRDRVVGAQIDLLVLDRFPQAFDEDVVAPAAFAVHADRDAVRLEQAGERFAGELAALVGVEDIGFP